MTGVQTCALPISFIYNTDDKLPDVEQFVLDAGGVAIRGSADFDDNGKFTGAKLSQFRLSPGDEMKADIVNGAEGLKINVRGAAIDARPFLQSFLGQSADMQALRDVDIDLKSAAITGHNKQALASAELRLVKRGGAMRQLALNGRFGGDPASATLVSEGGGAANYRIVSQDAGAALSFLDLY